MASPAERPIYSIGAVARMLDVAAATIRNWEDRYGVVLPIRSDGGQRLYSRDDVEQLRFIRDEMNAGASAADAHRLLRERLVDGAGRLTELDADAPTLLILVAERDAYAADLMEYFLRTEGLRVVVVTHPEGVLPAYAESAPALTIVELLLAGGAGLDLCRELSALGAPAVLATSSLRLEDEAIAAGADAFLAKPFDPLAFVSVVKDLLLRSEMVRSRSGATA